MNSIVISPYVGKIQNKKDTQLELGKYQNQPEETRNMYLPAEWELQSGVQLTWPHQDTDWHYMLKEVENCFIQIAAVITQRELLIIATPHPEEVRKQLEEAQICLEKVILTKCPTNDTWARDHAFITTLNTDGAELLDFKFNGWGMKFAANYDNQINRTLYNQHLFNGTYLNKLDFVLEGGSIESDGKGTLLTTSECLLSANRNEQYNKADIEQYLKKAFNLQQILWLEHGYLEGDDTDSHIDTLARMCPNDTIVYVQCNDTNDPHYDSLKAMEEQLITFRTVQGNPYRLLPLPMPHAIIEKGERLPATYANFLIINGAVIYPTYAQPENDWIAGNILKKAFPQHQIIGIDCRALIKQHGSLHCVTMQYPAGVINKP